MYGWVKSTIFVRLVTIATSPITASKTCDKHFHRISISYIIWFFSEGLYIYSPWLWSCKQDRSMSDSYDHLQMEWTCVEQRMEAI
jgi:hypothetical protein